MLYSELINDAKKEVIITDDATLRSYLRPDYRYWLRAAGLTAENVSDFSECTDDIIAENLKLEVEAMNVRVDKLPIITDWIALMLNSSVDPAMLEQENDLADKIIEFTTMKDKMKDKESELERREKAIDNREKLENMFPGMNFSKRKP